MLGLAKKLNCGLVSLLGLLFSLQGNAVPIKLDLYTQEFPPLQVEVDGEPEGYVVKFIEAVVADAAKTVPMEISGVHFVPWKRAIRTTQSQPNSLFFSISRTPNREQQFIWLGQVSPYEVALYRHKDGPDVSATSLVELKDYSFSSQTASSFEELTKKLGINNNIPVSYGKDAIRLLRAKRVDFAPLVTASFHYRMEEYGFNPDDFVEVMRVEQLCKELWLVTGKETSPEVVNALVESFKRLKAEGLLEQLINEYHPKSEVMTRYRGKV